jgi:hypothetical protein
MRNRCYNPYYGRFYSEDPVWSTNLFPYADNNPITNIDPDGLKTKKKSGTRQAWDKGVQKLNERIPIAIQSLTDPKTYQLAFTLATLMVDLPLYDDLAYPTNSGNYPSWNTVKNRYWNKYNNGKVPSGYAKVRIRTTGEIKNLKVSKELHHINGREINNPHSKGNLLEVWPWDHEIIDKSRHIGYDFIEWIKY